MLLDMPAPAVVPAPTSWIPFAVMGGLAIMGLLVAAVVTVVAIRASSSSAKRS